MSMNLSSIIPGDISSECSVFRADNKGNFPAVCMDTNTLSKVKESLNITNNKSTPGEILEVAKKETSCDTEVCVLEALESKIGKQKVSQELFKNFKHEGPTNDKLLSNYNIDDLLRQFAMHDPSFVPLNFNMLNYASYSFVNGEVLDRPDTLATISVEDWHVKGGKKKLGCVINTDVYQGQGKHWMALFVDTTTVPCTVEFFNSSGNSPLPEYVRWLEKTKIQLESCGKRARTCNISRIQHQDSKTECGVYSVFYIYARLKGIPFEVFERQKIDDKWMFHFRQLIFYDDKNIFATKDKIFNWEEYQKKVSIKWE